MNWAATLILIVFGGHGVAQYQRAPEGGKLDNPEQLINDLRSDVQAVNSRALTFLFHLGPISCESPLADRKKEIAKALIRFLDDAKKRKEALLLLANLGPEAKEAVPNIMRFIKRSTPADDRLALAAQYTLRRIGPSAAESVTALIDSSPAFYYGRFDNVQYRRDLPITLAKIGPRDPKVWEFLLKGLRDKDLGVRVHSAWQLWELGNKDCELIRVLTRAQEDGEADVRERVGEITASISERFPEFLPLALNAMQDQDTGVRKATVGKLAEGWFTQEVVIEAYLKALCDPHWYVRCGACKGLGKAGRKAEKAIPRLKCILRDKEGMVQVYGAEALYAINPNMAAIAVGGLIQALTDASGHVRAAAAKILGSFGPAARQALPALRRALQDEWASSDAAAAIAKIESLSNKPG